MSAADRDTKVVKINGKQIFLDVNDDAGKDAPALFFLHGLGSNTSFWEATLSDTTLSKTYRLVRYDFDGHGLSPASTLAFASGGGLLTIDDLVEDLGAVMDYVGVQKAAGVVGHSMSGLVASTFAARNPERLEKLILLGAMRAPSPAVQTTMLKRATTVRTAGLSAVVNTVVSSALSKKTKETSPLSAALVRSLVLAATPAGYAAACHALAGAGNPDYQAIKAQTLIVHGSEDYMSNQETADALEQSISGAKRVVMDEVGHWHAVEAPLELRKIFEDFFLA
ncbi:hypothetical protein JCM8097_007290 [Rhodosporidiobolus ruineniae]